MRSKILSTLWELAINNKLTSALAVGITLILTTGVYRKLQQNYPKVKKFYKDSKQPKQQQCNCMKNKPKLKILYGSTAGSSRRLSKKLQQLLKNNDSILQIFESIECICTDQYDPEDELLNDASNGNYLIILMPTFTGGEPPENARWFCQWIKDAANDFRLSKNALSQLSFAILGIGDSIYGDDFCLCSFKLTKALKQLSSRCLYKTSVLDRSALESIEDQFQLWYQKILSILIEQETKCCSSDSSSDSTNYSTFVNVGDDSVNADDDDDDDGEFDEDYAEEYESKRNDQIVTDLEDIVTNTEKKKSASNNNNKKQPIRDMLTTDLRKELTKQGYKLIGTHSGVKLCRWTKSMLRGRGGCYKYTFYGIESHRCMEATPSLACANKCVFCWRHHTNPVGTEWKWNMDPPDMIFNNTMNAHYAMIKQYNSVPGVLPERIDEAMHVRHCALSLVGEPIMYPEINEFIRLLHSKEISTFLVTNAQFPDEIKRLDPVTQLYVSVDASSKVSLKKIDRPLFRDFWERFNESLRLLSFKGQRTVYRLTLVKSWNSEEIDGYAKLVILGQPDFIEIKGVTYCGTSMNESNLTMKNVPWHEEVVRFGKDLLEIINQQIKQRKLNQSGISGYSENFDSELYGLACEHEHSNCLLLARRKFYINNQWYTWIDYSKFNQLIQEYYRTNGERTFTSIDYLAPTPKWATFGASEQGFNPNDTRFRKKRNHTYDKN
uniref:S-adenosyl-L-methionine-dependent tRNA 4-demethylwyosine synthase TYW1 n=1 Tax=Dermatophagoides pteronyssinus TaxID=6956 RepID=A0A6P6YE61_DERPT|nr:S-adenosyl-L-methionine-dependent tRNA 4-demethylwyosine synthase-like [Dermatophagoides pteronyssinus]